MLRTLMNDLVESAAVHTKISKSWLNYIQSPKSIVTVKFPVEIKNEIVTITGTRVVHSNHHLPTKGGLRFSETNLEDLEALAEIMSYKAGLHNIPFGGAKGCIYINPKKFTLEEKIRITRRFTVEMWKRSMINSSTDVMGPDVGTDEKIMNVIKETYKSILQTSETAVNIDAVVTGKSPSLGGLEFSDQSAGYGIARAIQFIEDNQDNDILRKNGLIYPGSHKRSVIFHGFNKNSYNAARRLRFLDYKIVGITHEKLGAYSPVGFDPVEIWNYKLKNQSLKGISRAINNEELVLSQKCDFLVAGNGEQTITKQLIDQLKCKFIVEGINCPLTQEAAQYAKSKGIVIIPDLIAYSGGFIVSYLEWLKNLEHRNLTLLHKRFDANQKKHLMRIVTDSDLKSNLTEMEGPEENELVRLTLEEIMDSSFFNALNVAHEHKIDLKTASVKIALERMHEIYNKKGAGAIF